MNTPFMDNSGIVHPNIAIEINQFAHFYQTYAISVIYSPINDDLTGSPLISLFFASGH